MEFISYLDSTFPKDTMQNHHGMLPFHCACHAKHLYQFWHGGCKSNVQMRFVSTPLIPMILLCTATCHCSWKARQSKKWRPVTICNKSHNQSTICWQWNTWWDDMPRLCLSTTGQDGYLWIFWSSWCSNLPNWLWMSGYCHESCCLHQLVFQ